MQSGTVRSALVIIGVVALVIGGVWVGQGANLIPGSFMTGDTKWLIIGAIIAVVGIVLIVLGVRRRGARGGR